MDDKYTDEIVQVVPAPPGTRWIMVGIDGGDGSTWNDIKPVFFLGLRRRTWRDGGPEDSLVPMTDGDGERGGVITGQIWGDWNDFFEDDHHSAVIWPGATQEQVDAFVEETAKTLRRQADVKRAENAAAEPQTASLRT